MQKSSNNVCRSFLGLFFILFLGVMLCLGAIPFVLVIVFNGALCVYFGADVDKVNQLIAWRGIDANQIGGSVKVYITWHMFVGLSDSYCASKINPRYGSSSWAVRTWRFVMTVYLYLHSYFPYGCVDLLESRFCFSRPASCALWLMMKHASFSLFLSCDQRFFFLNVRSQRKSTSMQYAWTRP